LISPHINEFLFGFLDKHKKLNELYSFADLLEEFKSIETVLAEYNNRQNVDWQSIYKTFLEKTDKIWSETEKPLLGKLKTAIFSKLERFSNSFGDDLIIDLKKFFDNLLSKFDINDEIEQQIKTIKVASNVFQKIINLQQPFKEALKLKISEAKSFVHHEFHIELQNLQKEINNSINVLIQEVVFLTNNLLRQIGDLEAHREKIKYNLRMAKIFGVFKDLSSLLSFLGPVGAAAGELLNVGLAVGENFATKPGMSGLSSNIELLKLETEELVENWQRYKSQKDAMRAKTDTILLQNLNEIKNSVSDEAIIEDVANLETIITAAIPSRMTVMSYLKAIGNKLKNVANSEKVEELLNLATQITNLGSTVVDAVQTFISGNEELDNINQQISQIDNSLAHLADYEEQIESTLRPMIEHMMGDMGKVSAQLEGQSSISLDIAQWNVQRALKTIKLQVVPFTKECDVTPTMIHHIDILNDLMATIIKIFDRVQDYKYQIQLSEYMADTNLAQWSEVDDENNASLYLEKSMIGNIIHGQYHRAVIGFSQWIFPFGPECLKRLQPLVSDTTELEIKAYKKNILALKNMIEDDKTTIRSIDQYINEGTFGSKLIPPFYVWTTESDDHNINNLLSGKKVQMKASIHSSTKNVVKLQTIELQLKTFDESEQTMLDDLLDSFEVTLTHSGSSHYKCMDTIFTVNSEKVVMLQSFEKANGKQTNYNIAYAKLIKGDIVLSPYTKWEFQLKNGTKSFDQLAVFANKTSIQLVGRAQFIGNETKICSESLKNYYQFDEIETEIYRMNRADDVARAQTNSHITKKRSIDMPADPVTSSSSQTKSFINDFMVWTAHKTNAILSLFTKTASSAAYSDVNSVQLQHIPSESTLNMPANYGFDTNSTLFLLDTIVRKFTKAKLIREQDDSRRFLDAQVLSLNIVQACEDNFRSMKWRNNRNLENYVDFSALHKAVFAKIVQFDDIQNVELVQNEAKNFMKDLFKQFGIL
jgi:hypothetical protein